MPDNPIARLRTAVDARDLPSVQDCLAEGATIALPQLDRLWTTATVAEAITSLFTAFPDFSWHPSRRYEADGAIVEEGVWSGTHRGPLAQLPATHLGVKVPARIAYDLAGTAIASMTISTDLAALFLALGLPVSLAAAAHSAAAYAGVETPTSTAVIGPAEPPAPEPAGASGRHRATVLGGVALVVAAAAVGAAIAARNPSRQTTAAATATATSAPPSAATLTAAATASVPTETATESPDPGPTTRPTPTPSPPVPVIVHDTVNLSTDVLFDTGSATLTPSAHVVLNQIVGLLTSHHIAGAVDVNGYTDNVGTPAFNLALSQQRADAVVAALRAASGTQPITIVGHGFGENNPLATNGTPTGRQHNRRVTIQLPPSSG